MPTDWERRVAALVAKGQACNQGNPQVTAAFLEDRLKGKGSLGITGVLRIGLAVAEAPEANSGHLLQGATESPVGEHAIDPVGRLTDVFEQQDHAAQVWQMGGAQ